MNMSTQTGALVLVLVTLLCPIWAASLPSENVSSCARQCTQSRDLVQYLVGNNYRYEVELGTTLIKDKTSEQQQQVSLKAIADISVHSACELVLRLSQAKVSDVLEADSFAARLLAHSAHFAYEDGRLVQVCPAGDEDLSVLDVKKSIMSALQMSSPSITSKQSVIESDIMGHCETIYEPIEQSIGSVKLLKTKHLSRCSSGRHQTHSQYNPFLPSALTLLNGTYECEQQLTNNVISRASCLERQHLWPSSMQIVSKTFVRLLNVDTNLVADQVPVEARASPQTLWMSFDSAANATMNRQYSYEQVEDLLSSICIKSADSVEADLPELVHELIVAKRYSLEASEEQKLWQSVHTGRLCGGRVSPKLVDIYLDTSARASTPGAIDVLILAYEMNMLSPQRASYLFSMLSFARHPTLSTAEKLVALLEITNSKIAQDHIPRGIIIGISGYMHNLKTIGVKPSEQSAVNHITSRAGNVLLGILERTLYKVLSVPTGQTLAVVDALRNIRLDQHQQPVIIDRLVHLVKESIMARHFAETRVAILRVLTHLMNDSMRHFLFEQIFENRNESPEMQIEAYRTLVYSGVTKIELEHMRTHLLSVEATPSGRQVANYVRSHQQNLRVTNDPSRRALLPADAPKFEPPSKHMFGISRNFELGYIYEPYRIGFRAETDVIYNVDHGEEQQERLFKLPHQLNFNLTLPFMDKQVALVEVRVHQHGLEKVLIAKLGGTDRVRKLDTLGVVKQLLSILITDGPNVWLEFPAARLVIELAVDGKTVGVFDQADLVRNERNRQSLLADVLASLHKQLNFDQALTLTPFDNVLRVSSLNGLPIEVRLNSTIVFGLKGDVALDARRVDDAHLHFNLWPSVSAKFESALEFYAGHAAARTRKSFVSTARVYAAPQVNFKLETHKGRVVTLKVAVPKERYTLAQVKSLFISGAGAANHGRLERRRSIAKKVMERLAKHAQHECLQWTRTIFGLTLCMDSLEDVSGQQAERIVELSLQKMDPHLQTIELSMQFPFSVEQIFAARPPLSYRQLVSSSRTPQFKLNFDTPGSVVNRKVVLELDLPRVEEQSMELEKEFQLRFSAPSKDVVVDFVVLHPNGISAKLTVDGKSHGRVELSYNETKTDDGDRHEYRPKVVLSLPSRFEPIKMEGLVVLEGRPGDAKKSLHMHLDDVVRRHTYLRASLMGNGWQGLSAHGLWDGLGLWVEAQTALEQLEKVSQFHFDAGYRTFWMSQREKFNVAFKVHDFSNEGSIKWNNFGTIEMSQLAEYNARYSQSAMLTTGGEAFEHTLQLGWGQHADEPQVHWSQSGKLDIDRVGGRYHVKARAVTRFTPKAIDYQLVGKARLNLDNRKMVKELEGTLEGTSRTTQTNNVHGELRYRNFGQSPLMANMSLVIQSPKGVDFCYEDHIEETEVGKYRGKMMLQLSPENRYEANYHYSRTGDEANQQHHELDIQLKHPASQWQARHRSLLRMSPDQEVLLKTRLEHNNNNSNDSLEGLVQWHRVGEFIAQLRAQSGRSVAHQTMLKYVPATSLVVRSDNNNNNNKEHSNDGTGHGERRKRQSTEAMSYEPTVRFSSIWVEEMLTRCTFNASSWGRSHFRRRKVEPTTLTANRRGRQRFVHLEVLIEADGQDDSLVVAKVASTTQRQNPNKRSLEVRLGHLGILVHNSLAWRFDRNNRTTLSRHESIDIEGGTLRLVLAQPSIMGTLHLDLWWTPKRNLLVVKFVAFKLPREPFQVRVEHKTLSRPPAIGRLPMQNFEFEELSDSYYSRLRPVTNEQTAEMRNASCLYWMYQQNIQFTPLDLETCRRVVDGCSIGAYFVVTQELARSPDSCLECQHHKVVKKFGSRRAVETVEKAEVVFVLDGTCHRQERDANGAKHTDLSTLRLLKKLTRFASLVHRHFREERVITEFGLVAPDLEGKYRLVQPLASRLNVTYLVAPTFKVLINASALSSTNLTIDIVESFWPAAGVLNLDFLELFPYTPPSTSRHFVLIDCIDASTVRAGRRTSCLENDIDFSTARSTILNSPIYLHLITGMGAGVPIQITPKLERVIGIDWKHVYLGALPPALMAASQPSFSFRRSLDNDIGSRADKGRTRNIASTQFRELQPTLVELRKLVRPYADNCHLLAIETNGSVFDHRVFAKNNRHILAERLVDNHKKQQKLRCDCMLAKDRLVAEEQCTLHSTRKDTLPTAPHRGGAIEPVSGNQVWADQVWNVTEEDQQTGAKDDKSNSTVSENIGLFDFLFGQSKDEELEDDKDDTL